MTEKKDWFKSWFNTKYYHILYKHRDDTEARIFIRNMLEFLDLNKDDLLLDLACGKGRHSIYLNSLGFNVIGADLSKNSIDEAKKFENERLKFVVRDMRHTFKRKYNAIFNLFTSFCFFEDDNEDIVVLRNVKNALQPNGVAVIDFMNAKQVISNLVVKEEQVIDGIHFRISRYVEGGFIVKKICFTADGQNHTFYEKVKSIDLLKILSYAEAVGFKIKHIFGNYQLDPFDEHTSDRLILVLE